ncbi:hypothetical protein SteCoe_18829 [Stentor coeruleus]|uniref:Ion transport domain-containing protein n=1 Tax=Stentor coeruleus TaxID=5963 RepID=A0A1R2BVZ5_9CILI|nr:hypothetical protein SteCoe_18829 [Stentor coeruleus]
MSGLSEPLMKNENALNISQTMKDLALHQNLENKVPEISDIKQIKKGFKEIKAAVNKTFKYKDIEFPYECELIKLSPKHSLLVGSSSKESELVLIDLKIMKECKRIKTNLGSLACMKINEKESKIYLSTDDGRLASFDFPSFSEDSYNEVRISSSKVVFDEVKDCIYAYDYDKDTIVIYNFTLGTKEILAKCRGVEFIRASDDNNFLSVSTNSHIYVYSRQQKWATFVYKIEKGENYNYEQDENGDWYWVDKKCEVEFSHFSNKFAISIENKIYLWEIEKYKNIATYQLHTSKDITSVKFSKNDDYLVAVGVDHSINIWDLSSTNPLPKFLNQPLKDLDKEGTFDFSNRFYDLEIDEDRNLIYTHGIDSKYSYQWKGIFLDKARFPDSKFIKENHKCITCKRTNQVIVTNVEKSELYIWDIETLDMSRVVKIPEGVPRDICFGDKDEKILLVGADSVVYAYDFDTMGEPKKLDNDSLGLVYALKANENYVFGGGSKAKIVIQDYNGGLIMDLGEFSEKITSIVITDSYVIGGDIKGNVIVYNLEQWTVYARLKEHTAEITTMEVFKNSETLLTIGKDKKCIFWSLYDKIPIKIQTLEDEVDSCYLSNDEKSFILSTTKGKVTIYNLPSFEKINCFKYKFAKHQRFACDKDEKYLIVSHDEGVFRTLSPIHPDNPTIIDDNISIPEMRRFLEGDRSDKVERKDTWIIAPFMVNSLHYYSNENLKKELKKAMINKSKYLKSSVGNPLNISLAKGNTEATGTIINQLKCRVSDNLFALETLSDCLIQLNQGGFKGLDELYNDCLIPVPASEKLPDSCDAGLKLPIVSYSLTMKVNAEKFIGPPSEDSDKKITFLVSAIRMNLEIGSQESLDFLQSLLDCSNTEIFKTKFIQYILNDKWNKVRKIMFFNGLLFILYLISLSIYVIYRDPLFLLIALIWSILMFLYELVQMYIDICGYFTEFWNYIDLSRAGLFYVYFYFGYIKYYEATNIIKDSAGQDVQADPTFSIDNYIWLLVSVTILSWVRGITLFALSTSTRYMISLLTEVIKDIIAFAVVVFYSILSFAFIKMAFTESTEANHSVFIGGQILGSFFEATGGGDNEVEGFTLALVIFNLIFNVIIMMNLLISILGTTYGRVNDDAQVEDLKQLTEMIIEAESFYLNRRNDKKKTIMQICEEYTPAEVVGENDMRTRFRTVKTEISMMKQKNDELHRINFKKIEELDQRIIDTQGKIESSKKDIINEFNTAIKDLGKKILAANQVEDAQEEQKNPFVCLSGHSLKPKHLYGHLCDICRDGLNDVDAFCCKICDFDMCMKCAQLYYDHSHKKAGLSCKDGHILLNFENSQEFFTEQGYESEQKCRFCFENIKGEVYHCLPCMFNLCSKCKDTYELSTKSKDAKLVCKSTHNLKWRHKDLYEKESLLINCSDCKEERTGAGFYCCVECPSYWCLKCITKQLASGSEDGQPEDRNIPPDPAESAEVEADS